MYIVFDEYTGGILPEHMKRIWKILSHLGNNPKKADLHSKSIVFVNRISIVMWLFIFTSIIINLILKSYHFIPVLSAGIVLISFNFLLNHWHKHLAAKVNMILTLNLLLLYMSYAGGAGSGLEFYFLSLTILPLIIFQRPLYIYIFEAMCIASLIIQRIYFSPFFSTLEPDAELVFSIFYIINSIYSCLLIILGIIFFRRINDRNERQLMEANRIVEKKNEELEQLNKRLDSFSSTVSHDLRAPLRGIMTVSNILKEDYKEALDEEGQNLIEMQVINVRKMDKLIEDILEFARAGKQKIEMNEIDMGALANEVIHELLDPVQREKVKFNLQPLPSIKADRSLMKQVFINLVSNAIKYSAKVPQPVIEIGSYKEEGEYIFFIKDNGVGFDMSYSTKLFKVFQRLHSSEEFEGTGLGLAIVHNIISGHGGRTWAVGKPNEGATFYFSLPISNN